MGEERRVLVTVPGLTEDRGPAAFERLRAAGLGVSFSRHPRVLGEDELITALDGVFATIASGEPYTERVLAAAKALRVIARLGVGHDKVDVAAATRHGVAVAMAFGTNHEAVADHAIALMAALASRLVPYHQRVVGGEWSRGVHKSLWRSTVGIVGLGRIGRALARRCHAFEMRVLAYDPAIDAEAARAGGIEPVSLEQLLAEADFVSLHAPHTPATDRLIDRERLALMKPTAYLINTARGGLIDEDALLEALTSGRIAGAGLDVFRKEPPVGSPLLALPNVVLTPHVAGSNERSYVAALDRCAESIIAIADGRDPGAQYLLNPEALTRPRT